MLLRQENADGVDVLSVSGDVGGADTPLIVRALEQALDRRPRGVVVDLRDVTALAPDAVLALRDLADERPGWPRTSLNLFGARPEVQRALTGLVVHPTRNEALDHVDDRQESVVREVVRIEPTVQGPAQARRVVMACAAELGLADEGDDLVLLVSEMVTNAVRHGSPPIDLEVLADDDTITLAVADASPVHPAPRDAAPDAENGRGMALVDLLTEDHGVRPDPAGKTVWAAVRRRSASPS